MEHLSSIFITNLAAVMAMMIAVWLLSLIKRDASIVDVFWGLGFVVVAWITFLRADGYLARKVLITLLTTLWGLRLALHILIRNWGHGEDRRYQVWRAQYGARFWWISLFTVFGLQGVLLWVISLVIQVGQIAAVPARLVVLDLIGLIVWTIGFIFEVVADYQLYRFKADPENQGKVLNKGLWAYTRHPNYFGESLVWWGLYIITLTTIGSTWVVISPLLITFLLVRVSGVTLLEKTIVDSRPGYQEYMKNTSSFIPWFPRKDKP